MTTIDRAGLAGRLAQRVSRARLELESIKFNGEFPGAGQVRMSADEADALLAALRQPDQKGEAVERRVAGGPACPTCGFRIVKKEHRPFVFDDEEGDLVASARPYDPAAPQPAPEAGKLPSEEATLDTLGRMFAALPPAMRPQRVEREDGGPGFAASRPGLYLDLSLEDDGSIEFYGKTDAHGLALLSPAQPHDVD